MRIFEDGESGLAQHVPDVRAVFGSIGDTAFISWLCIVFWSIFKLFENRNGLCA